VLFSYLALGDSLDVVGEGDIELHSQIVVGTSAVDFGSVSRGTFIARKDQTIPTANGIAIEGNSPRGNAYQ
jgi:hypothetical protein